MLVVMSVNAVMVMLAQIKGIILVLTHLRVGTYICRLFRVHDDYLSKQ